ncbi:MAG: GDSL-type esterase/lipase family protein, partial [Propionibacterium sp.]|nr:GDSL-type esterase/lipase family protein [Propionibacterium sp.]
YRTLVAGIRSRAPRARLVVTGILPRHSELANEVSALNARIRPIVAAAGGTYVDMHPELSGPSGELRREFSADALHLNGAGYALWVAKLRPLMPDSNPAVQPLVPVPSSTTTAQGAHHD